MRRMITTICANLRSIVYVAVVATIALANASAHAATPAQCQALAAHDFSNVLDAPTRVLVSTLIPAKGGAPAFCRVEGYVAATVGIEFHLPLENWNGKFVMQGCGGMCGSLQGIASCPEAVTRGYACGTTDMGHRGEGRDGKWAYNNLAAEIDHGHRGTHVATLAGKAITEAFYGRAIKRSYFRGCSTGGRQGLVEAQRYPYEFDGIVAGDAQLYSLMGPPLAAFWNGSANVGPDGKSVLTQAKLDAVHAAVIGACDAVDGLKDGLIGDPRQCKIDIGTLACKGGSGDKCLTEAEMAVVRKFYEGPRNKKGPFVRVGGMAFGSEPSWAQFLPGKAGVYYANATENMRYLAFLSDPGPSYDFSQFDWDRDPQRLNYSVFGSGDPDLELYANNGGKMILFHGWADTSNAPFSKIHYYERMTRVMGGLAETQKFARLFMFPGMFHCAGGYGVNAADMLGAIDAWVESGKAPDEILAYSVAGQGVGPVVAPAGFDGTNIAASNPKFARPLYPYPDTYRYSGGDPNAAASFRRARGKLNGEP